MFLSLTVLASIALADSDSEPVYRVCAESTLAQTAPTWSVVDRFPYLSFGWQTTHEVVVRPLSVLEPSWMWGRPLLAPDALPERLTVRIDEPVPAGAVLYIDASALPASSAPAALAPDALRLNVLRDYGDRVELELCPELRGIFAAR